MNETFDIRRLSKLVGYEVVNYIPRFFKSLLIFASVIVAVWIFSLTVEEPIMPYDRSELVNSLFVLAITLSPFIVYKDMNNRKRGYIYAMMPASTLEKLLSMLVLCVVVVPLLSYAVLTASDLLLCIFSKMGAGSFKGITFYNPFADSMAKVLYIEEGLSYSLPVFDGLLYIMCTVSYTIMFNTIFRKNKVMKTILFNVAMVFAFVILSLVVANMVSPEFWEELFEDIRPYFESMTAEEALRWTCIVGRCTTALMTMLFLTITYFRIKKVNY